MIDYSRCIIIFSGYNQRAIIAFLRTLEKNQIDNYLIIAKSDDDDVFLTKYKEKVAVTRKEKRLSLFEIVNIIKELKTRFGIGEFLIAPSTEALNRFILQYRESFNALGALDYFVDDSLYQMISDKKAFGNICCVENIPVPKEIEFPKEFIEPFVAKPIRYVTIKEDIFSPVIIKNRWDYELFVDNYLADDFYYQEYVDGRSIYLLYYIARNKTVYRFSQENFLQQPFGKSIIVAKAARYHETEMAENFQQLFLKMNYYGFVMVEVRYCLGVGYMIEANPRFWGPSQLFVDAGYNFFEFFLRDYGFLSNVRTDNVDYEATYYWHNGVETVVEKENIVFYNGFEKIYNKRLEELIENDIYRRDDTMKLFYMKK